MATMQGISQCTVVLTRDCNLRCNFCYAKEGGYDPSKTIDFQDLRKIIDFCADSKVKYLFFTGGEPLLYPRILETLEYAKTRSHAMTTAVASNGIVLGDFAFCKALVDSGLDYIDVSTKGKNADEWRRVTGYDGHSQSRNAIQNLSKLPIEFTYSMVVNHTNVETICDTVESATNLGATQFSFTFVIDNDTDDSSESGFEYLKAHNPISLIGTFMDSVDRLDQITNNWWIEYSLPLCLYNVEQRSRLRGKLADPCQVHMRNAVTFDTDMSLLPCDLFIDDTIGKLGIDFFDYASFVEFARGTTYQRVVAPLWQHPSSECLTCGMLDSCYGGCPVLWKHYTFEDMRHLQRNRGSQIGRLG